MKYNKGFTLVELMITVVIVGILAAVAIPNYQNYVVKGNRAAAQAFMMDVASREKQYLLDARTYAPNLAALYNVATDAAATPADVSKHYTVAICINLDSSQCTTADTPPYFKITATPPTSSQQAADGELTLDSSGEKSPAGKW